MNVAAWVLQIYFALYFIAIGVLHFVLPAGLPGAMEWMYDLPTGLHYASGAAEILGGLGLVLPAVTRIRPQLVPLAAAALALLMVMAAVWHVPRGEIVPNVVSNLIAAAVLAFLAWVRWRKHPLPAK